MRIPRLRLEAAPLADPRNPWGTRSLTAPATRRQCDLPGPGGSGWGSTGRGCGSRQTAFTGAFARRAGRGFARPGEHHAGALVGRSPAGRAVRSRGVEDCGLSGRPRSLYPLRRPRNVAISCCAARFRSREHVGVYSSSLGAQLRHGSCRRVCELLPASVPTRRFLLVEALREWHADLSPRDKNTVGVSSERSTWQAKSKGPGTCSGLRRV